MRRRLIYQPEIVIDQAIMTWRNASRILIADAVVL
jgi:hypothetical protein